MAGVGDGEAVSSVVGTILMLSVTVTLFSGVSLWVMEELQEEPRPTRAELAVLEEGTQVLLVHRGGEPVDLDGTLLVNVDGFEVELDLAGFASQAGPSGRWGIGESLCVSGPSPPCLLDHADVFGVLLIQAGTVLLNEGERGTENPCPTDTTPPTVSLWVQSPADVTAGTAGGVSVTLTATDDCVGVDSGADPTLRYRVNDGSDPAYAAVASTSGGGGVWTATIPAQAWSTLDGDTLQYYAEGLEDLNGNAGDSTVQGDLIDPISFPDPGFPFEDVDGDRRYTVGTDVALTLTQVQDGLHDAGAHGLVIPASVGAITASGVDFQADGDLVVGVALTAQTDPLQLSAGGDILLDASPLATQGSGDEVAIEAGGALSAPGVTVQSKGDLTLTSAGTADLAGAVLETLTNGDAVQATSSAGSLTLTGATVESRGPITLDAAAALSAAGAGIGTLNNGDSTQLAAGTAVDLTGATVSARGHLDIAAGTGITVSGAVLETVVNDRDITLDAGGAVTGDSGTELTSRGHLTLDGASLTLPGARLALLENGKDLTATATGAASLAGADVEARGHVDVTAGTSLDLSFATVDILQSSKRLKLIAATSLDAASLTANAQGPLQFTGASVALGSAQLTTTVNGDDVTVTATGGALDATSLAVAGKGGFTATASGAATLTSSQIVLSGTTEDIVVSSTGASLTATGVAWSTPGRVTASAATSLSLGGTIASTSNSQDLSFTATSGAITLASGSTVSGKGHITFTAGTSVTLTSATVQSSGVSNKDLTATAASGDIGAQGATLRTTRNIKLNVNSASHLALGGTGTLFDDANDKADVTPNGRHNNTPAGVWE